MKAMMMNTCQMIICLFAVSSGQRPTMSVIGRYVTKGGTAYITCSTDTNITGSVAIARNGVLAFECPIPDLCYNSGLSTDYNATQNVTAGTTTLIIQNADQNRDGANWTCSYLGGSPSANEPLTVVTIATSKKIIEKPDRITLELICTYPTNLLSFVIYLGGMIYLEATPNRTVYQACTSNYEASVNYTLTFPKKHSQFYNGTFNVSINNGFYNEILVGSTIYTFFIADTTTQPTSTTTTTTNTVTSSSLSSTSMSSTTSSATTDNTSTKPTTNGSTASATSSTFRSTSPTTVLPHNATNNISTSRSPRGSTVSATSNTSASTSSTAVSPANNTSIASTSADPTTAEPTATNKTSAGNKGTKNNISDTDIKVIVPAVVVPCGLLIIGAIVLVVFCVRRKARKNVRESPDGMAIQDKGNDIDGWKQSLGHGKATDNLDTVYTTPDGFIIYPGPAAVSTARSFKDKKYHGVTDQYSRPNPGTHHHQADYIPSTYTSARAYTHRGKKHHVVTDQYSRPYPDTYGYQSAYFPSTYKSARTYAQKGKTYEGHQPASNLMANSRLAYDQPAFNPMANSRLAYDQPASNLMATSRLVYDQPASNLMANSRLAYGQTAYYPQTGYYGQSGQDVYYSGGGQYSYGQRSRSHNDHNGRKQQRDYYSQYEMAGYRGDTAGYRHTKQDTAFYY